MERFKLGQLMTTPGAIDAAETTGENLFTLIRRHAVGDWGVVGDEDKRANERALLQGSRLLSSYLLNDGAKLWVITEADRSATTVLLPDEY